MACGAVGRLGQVFSARDEVRLRVRSLEPVIRFSVQKAGRDQRGKGDGAGRGGEQRR